MTMIRLALARPAHRHPLVRLQPTPARASGHLRQPNEQLLPGLVIALLVAPFVVLHSDPLVAAIGAFAIYAAVRVAYPVRVGCETWASTAARARRDVKGRTIP